MGMKKNNPGCNCCCNCATGYVDIRNLWSQIEATVTAPISLTPAIEFLTAPGTACGDGMIYAYNVPTHASFSPNRIQYDGPTDCGDDIYGQPMYGLFIFLPYDSSGDVALGPALEFSVEARCIDGVLYYCWEANLGYQVMESNTYNGIPNLDCHGTGWALPNLPSGASPNTLIPGISVYTSTTGDETTTVRAIRWGSSSSGLVGDHIAVVIVVNKQGCSTDIADIPTSFTLAPAYNPAGISVGFTLS